jgi:hypothetical protein
MRLRERATSKELTAEIRLLSLNALNGLNHQEDRRNARRDETPVGQSSNSPTIVKNTKSSVGQ